MCLFSLLEKKKDLSPLSKASAPTQGKDPDVGGGTVRRGSPGSIVAECSMHGVSCKR